MSLYEPCEDSFLLEEAVKDFLKKHSFNSMKILDMGTGPGTIIEFIEEISNEMKIRAKLYAVDINKKICRIKKRGINYIISNLFSSINSRFDLIVFNPPYLPEGAQDSYLDEDSKKSLIGGKEGCEITIKFLEELPEHLENNGKCIFLVSSFTERKKIEKKLSKKFEWEIVKERKFAFEKLYVYIANKRQY